MTDDFLKFLSATTGFLFGESIDDLSPSAGSDLGKAFDEAMFGSGMRIALGPLGFLAKSKKWLSACQTTRSFAEKYVQRALEYSSVQSKEHLSSDEKKRVLLYNLADHVKDTDRLRNDILQAFFVSQGTTANCVSNVLFLVARQDGMWQELRQEVLRVLPASGLPTYSMIQTLAMLRQVVDEGMFKCGALWMQLKLTGKLCAFIQSCHRTTEWHLPTLSYLKEGVLMVSLQYMSRQVRWSA